MKTIPFNLWVILTLVMTVGLSSCSNDDNGVVPSKEVNFGVNPAEIEFNANGGNAILNLNSPQEWTISGTGDWLSVNHQSENQSRKVTLKAMPNESEDMRTATLMIESGDNSQSVEVMQQGATVEPGMEYDVPPDHTGISEQPSVTFAQNMTVGWNLGNTLEAIGGETAWGNPMATQELIDSVKAAGFNAVRIPVAWSKFSNENDFTIQQDWMDRVQEVVDYVISNDMYAIMNIHWDGGWMQPTYDEEEYVNNRLEAMWKQIATHFRDYGDHLMFAGTNEVMVEGDYSEPTQEYYSVQNGFNQTFVDAVRSTGGKNVYRYLVVQGFNTNIDYTVNYATIPDDVEDNTDRLMMEVHYYDPYAFTLEQNSDEVWQWGENAEDPSATAGYANEPYVTNQFQAMKSNFIDQGIAVILGEYGAMARTNVDGHKQYRIAYLDYVTDTAQEMGLVPFYWDNGVEGDHGFALFDRETGATVVPDVLDAVVE